MFLSGVSSPSHLVYAGAYLRHLLAGRPDRHVHLVDLGLGSFLGVRRVSEQDLRDLLPRSPRLSVTEARGRPDWRARPGEQVVYLAVGAPGIKPYLTLTRLHRRRPRCVVVDEGLGSYGGWRSRWAAARREGRRGPWGLVRAIAVTTAQRRLADERWPLYRKQDGRWQVDDRQADWFAALEAQAGPALPPGRRAVLLSQPWVELGQLPAARYLAILREIEAACTAASLTLEVRPHPVEDRERYAGVLLREGRGPAELDPAVTGARVLLGFNSTALINLAAMRGIPALRLGLPELAEVEAHTSTRQRSLLAAFLPAPVALGDLAERLRAVAPVPRAGVP